MPRRARPEPDASKSDEHAAEVSEGQRRRAEALEDQAVEGDSNIDYYAGSSLDVRAKEAYVKRRSKPMHGHYSRGF